MTGRLKEVKQRYIEIENALADPATLSDNELYVKLMKDYKDLTPLVSKYAE